MNLIFLTPADLTAPDTACLAGRRLKHVLEILKPRVGDRLTVGMESGRMGHGKVLAIDGKELLLQLSLDQAPPPKIPVILCVALMRPLVLKRVLLTAASLGVGSIVLFHSRQVEKSFWQSTALREEEIREQLILGLEQSRDTVLPTVSWHKRFRPFVEDVLPELLKGRTGIVADPSGQCLKSFAAGRAGDPVVLLVGPEGGFIPYEIDKFKAIGCRVVGLGPRVLKVETAIVTLLARIGDGTVLYS